MNIGIIGVGKLGLAYALLFERNGATVYASSYKESYVNELNQKKLKNPEPGITELLANATNITFTTNNHEVINNCNFIYVMVATPSTPAGDYDISAIEEVVNDFINHPGSVAGKILVIGSTVNPRVCLALQEKLADKKVHVIYSPTFVAQGTVVHDVENPHSVLIGAANSAIADTCEKVLYTLVKNNATVFKVHYTTAEILKLAGNCKTTMQISYTNLIGEILIKSGMEKDLNVVFEYLNDTRKIKSYKFGFGYGGPCFPRDNRSFVYYANNIGVDYSLGNAIDLANNNHANFLVQFIIKQNTNNLPIYFEYISYKKGVNILEESQQLDVCKKLLEQGYQVYVEPSEFLPNDIIVELTQQFGAKIGVKSLNDLNKEQINVYQIKL